MGLRSWLAFVPCLSAACFMASPQPGAAMTVPVCCCGAAACATKKFSVTIKPSKPALEAQS